MYLYLVVYRIKQVLDDLVYYEHMQHHAVTRGEPAYAFLTWVLWIVVGIAFASPKVFFGLMALIALLGLPWVFAAILNVRDTPATAVPPGIAEAHGRWWKFNLFPLVMGAIYFTLLSLGHTPDWSSFWPWWIGPLVMTGALIVDIVTDWTFMFRLGTNSKA